MCCPDDQFQYTYIYEIVVVTYIAPWLCHTAGASASEVMIKLTRELCIKRENEISNLESIDVKIY